MASCCVCRELLKEGDEVEALVRTTFHTLKSKVHAALDKDDMSVVPGTLAHIACACDEENYEPPMPDEDSN